MTFVANSVLRLRVSVNFGTTQMSPAWATLMPMESFPRGIPMVADAFFNFLGLVPNSGICRHGAGIDLEVGLFTDKWIRSGFRIRILPGDRHP